jgi:hypothetical protein
MTAGHGGDQDAMCRPKKTRRSETGGHHETNESQAVVLGSRRACSAGPDAVTRPASVSASQTRTLWRAGSRRDADAHADPDANPDANAHANPDANAHTEPDPRAEPDAITVAVRLRNAVRDPDHADDHMDDYAVHVLQLLPLAVRRLPEPHHV